jgi:hypothetical protein
MLDVHSEEQGLDYTWIFERVYLGLATKEAGADHEISFYSAIVKTGPDAHAEHAPSQDSTL